MLYKATLDKLARIITSCYAILLVGVSGEILIKDTTNLMGKRFLTMLFIISFVGAYIKSVCCYIIQADKLIIRKPIKDIKLYKNEIAQIDFAGSSGLTAIQLWVRIFLPLMYILIVRCQIQQLFTITPKGIQTKVVLRERRTYM